FGDHAEARDAAAIFVVPPREHEGRVSEALPAAPRAAPGDEGQSAPNARQLPSALRGTALRSTALRSAALCCTSLHPEGRVHLLQARPELLEALGAPRSE